MARALNTRFGRGENFWRSGSYGAVEVHGREALQAQLLYCWTNPTLDGQVPHPDLWPGVRYLPEDFGRTITVEKPAGAFFGGRRPAYVLERAARAEGDDDDPEDVAGDLAAGGPTSSSPDGGRSRRPAGGRADGPPSAA